MGQRFHFDLTNGEELIRDDEGIEASSPDEAIKEARAAVADMRSNEQALVPAEGWQLVIRNESGATVKAIALDDAVLREPASSTQAVPMCAQQVSKTRFNNWGVMILASQCLICL